jgi:hydrogenase maturation protease
VRLAVTLEDDSGRDLGDARQPGHRFFFAPEEVEPLPAVCRILVAGIGNVFLGDDGFGVAVAHRLAERPLPPGVLVADYGIRGLDLAYALQDEWDAAILVDTVAPRGEPGTLHVIEPELDAAAAPLDLHGMHPGRVLALARRIGRLPPRTLVVGCEPETVASGEPHDVLVELSAPVEAAVGAAVTVIETLIQEMTTRKVTTA